MDSDDLKQLTIKLAVIADRLDERSESAVRRVEQVGNGLDQSAVRLGTSAAGFAHDALQMVEQGTERVVSTGTGRALAQFEEQLRQATEKTNALVRELEHARDTIRRERRGLLWRASAALAIGALLSVGAAAYAISSSKQEVARNRIEAELLRAYNRADVTLCGDRLCANVDRANGRYGDRKQYLPVKPRQ